MEPSAAILTNRAKRDAAIAMRDLQVSHLPSEMTIAATDRCNLRCVTCGTHHSQSGDNNAGLADFPKHLVPKLEGMTTGAERIQLHGGGGEPLMSRSFWESVALFSSNPDAQIEFNTNGLLFTRTNIRRLMEHRVTFISISCDAATEQTYRQIRGGDFNRLRQNIAMLVEERARTGKAVRFSLNMTVAKANAHDMPALVRMAKDMGIESVELYKLNGGVNYDWVEQTADGFTFDYRDNLPERNVLYVRRFLDEARRLAGELGIDMMTDSGLLVALDGNGTSGTEGELPEYSQCPTPWRWLNIAANGDVYPCCSAVAPLANLADVGSLADIWNGQAMQDLRQNIRSNRIDPKICKGGSCPYVVKGSVKTDRDAVIAARDAALAERDAALAERAAAFAERAAALAERDAAQAERDAALTERERTTMLLAAVHSSTSWRITGPLRQVREIFRRSGAQIS